MTDRPAGSASGPEPSPHPTSQPNAFADPADVVLDARGLRCPLPVIRLADRTRSADPGTVVEVLATDPAARADIPAWCRMRGQDYLGEQDREPVAGSDDESPGVRHTAYRVRVTAAQGRTPAAAG